MSSDLRQRHEQYLKNKKETNKLCWTNGRDEENETNCACQTINRLLCYAYILLFHHTKAFTTIKGVGRQMNKYERTKAWIESKRPLTCLNTDKMTYMKFKHTPNEWMNNNSIIIITEFKRFLNERKMPKRKSRRKKNSSTKWFLYSILILLIFLCSLFVHTFMCLHFSHYK